jgi:hypothetical protein
MPARSWMRTRTCRPLGAADERVAIAASAGPRRRRSTAGPPSARAPAQPVAYLLLLPGMGWLVLFFLVDVLLLTMSLSKGSLERG